MKKAVEGLGRKCVTIAADLATSEGPVEAAKSALQSFGTIDILVNNAGIALIDPLLETKVEDWDQTMAVNLRAPFLIARELAPRMIAQRAGKIINISSQAGVVAIDGHAAYSASKGGLNMLTKVMTSGRRPVRRRGWVICLAHVPQHRTSHSFGALDAPIDLENH